MAETNYNSISLNGRGLNTFSKRKSVLRWLNKSKYDIILLQVTHTNLEFLEKLYSVMSNNDISNLDNIILGGDWIVIQDI
jgi:exonuclease III